MSFVIIFICQRSENNVSHLCSVAKGLGVTYGQREREREREKNGRLGFTKVLDFLGQIRILRGNLPCLSQTGVSLS